MKSGLFHLLNISVTNIAIIFCLAPFVLVIWKKLQYERVYTLIGIYWLLTGLLNQYNWVCNSQNYHLQAQLMFIRNIICIHFVFFIFFISSRDTKRKSIFYTVLCFILFELLLIIWNGLDENSNVVIIGIGSLIVLVYSVIALIEYIKEIEHSPFENVMAFANAAFLFAYGGITMIYILNYLNVATTSDPDEFFLYYVGLLLSSLLTCFAFWHYAEAPSFYKSKK